LDGGIIALIIIISIQFLAITILAVYLMMKPKDMGDKKADYDAQPPAAGDFTVMNETNQQSRSGSYDVQQLHWYIGDGAFCVEDSKKETKSSAHFLLYF